MLDLLRAPLRSVDSEQPLFKVEQYSSGGQSRPGLPRLAKLNASMARIAGIVVPGLPALPVWVTHTIYLS
jgi:hypothetical protein